MHVVDNDGYKYRIVKYNFKKNPKIPHLYSRNPYAYDNLNNYLSIERPNIKLISTGYKTCKDELEYICEIHKELGVQTTTLSNMYSCTDFCKGCVNKKRGLRYRISTDTIIKRCHELNLVYCDRYNNDIKQETMVKLICKKHKNKGIQNIAWDKLRTAAIGCPFCYGKYKTTEEIRDELYKINQTYELLSEYEGYEKQVICRCKKCGNTWTTSVACLKTGTGCPKCSASHGEKHISKVLDKLSIAYKQQYTFDDCVLLNKLKFDFYLPSYNTLIEYDGEQHFTPIDFAGMGEEWATKQFKKIQKRDTVKNNYCATHGIGLLRIPYWDYENIETIILNYINDIQESQETAG